MLLPAAAARSSANEVDLGGIVVSVSDSWTAQLFHVVDQLSEWDQARHRQYGRWAAKALNFDDQDRKLLQEHATLRRKRGWGNGFEQAFYVEDSIEGAVQKAVDEKFLSSEEASSEKRILVHFSPKLSVLRDRGAPKIASFIERLSNEAHQIAPTVQKLIRFFRNESEHQEK